MSAIVFSLAAPSGAVHADVAQLVAHHLAKVRVAGSNPVVRSLEGARNTPSAFVYFVFNRCIWSLAVAFSM